MLSKKDLYGNKGPFKYFIGYIHMGNFSTIPFCIKLPQMNGYVKYFDQNINYIYIYILVHNKEFLEKRNEIWDKISIL